MNAKILDDQIVTYPYTWSDFVKDNNNSNYPPDTDMLDIFPETDVAKEGYKCVRVVEQPKPDYNPFTQVCTQDQDPVFEDSQWVLKWTVRDMTQEELEAENEQRRQSNKELAEDLLVQTDWTEIPSVTNTEYTPHLINANLFVEYRLALRAIAVNPPINVNPWPVKPDEIWG